MRYLLVWQTCFLSTVPDGDYPDRSLINSVEKAIWLDYDFSMGKIRKLWTNPARFREMLKPTQRTLRFFSKSTRGGRIIPANICESFKELKAGGRC